MSSKNNWSANKLVKTEDGHIAENDAAKYTNHDSLTVRLELTKQSSYHWKRQK